MTNHGGAGACPECGAADTGGEGGCRRLFEEVIEREFIRPELFHVHRLTVDAYSLQHPERYMKSAKSAAAHLAGMCWSLEYGADPAASRVLSRWLDGTPELPEVRPPPPGRRGELTVRHVHAASDSADHVRRVRAWSESVWEAWSELHDRARAWVEEARPHPGHGSTRMGSTRKA